MNHLDAGGQWRDASGAIVRERSKLLIVLAAPGEAGMRRTDELAAAYKRAFGQESVLRAVTTACVSFWRPWAGAGESIRARTNGP